LLTLPLGYSEATAANFVGGFWLSGDLGYMDEDGFAYVVDRKKDMINRGGYKVFSAELESVLSEHPAVFECAVLARPCPVLGERVHAFICLRMPGVVSEDLAKFCETRLADYKRPESFTLQTEPLPRNPNGKLLKREVRAMLAAAHGGTSRR
jgi:long-chain acyl-CoA synthetase